MIDVIDYLERNLNEQIEMNKEELSRGNLIDMDQYKWLCGHIDAYKVILDNLKSIRKQMESGDE